MIHTPQGKFLAGMAAAGETCAASSDNRKACEDARICEYTFEEEPGGGGGGRGTCGVTPTWVRRLKRTTSTTHDGFCLFFFSHSPLLRYTGLYMLLYA